MARDGGPAVKRAGWEYPAVKSPLGPPREPRRWLWFVSGAATAVAVLAIAGVLR